MIAGGWVGDGEQRESKQTAYTKPTTSPITRHFSPIVTPQPLRGPGPPTLLQSGQGLIPLSVRAMFSKSLARAANRTCAAAAGSSTCTTSAVQRTTQCLAARRQPHQRRHSSSKASSSCPPGDPASDGKPVAEEKAAIADSTAQEQQQQQPQRGTKRVTRSKRSRPAGVPDKQEDQFAGLPAVPGMQMSSSGKSTSILSTDHILMCATLKQNSACHLSSPSTDRCR